MNSKFNDYWKGLLRVYTGDNLLSVKIEEKLRKSMERHAVFVVVGIFKSFWLYHMKDYCNGNSR